MVTAGIYMIARSNVLYVNAEITNNIISIIGAATALLAASIALRQNDIKKVLAYSTVSQLGYMFLALGSGAYVTAVFHVMTHAFFKALLFLGAGSVIHAMGGEQDITKMGGLGKKMKITYATFFIATLAISGIPPFAGFFSKEEILLAAYQSNKLVYGIGLFVAALTAFYMFRLYFSVFWKKQSTIAGHHGEGGLSMKMPLVVLAICTVVAGFIPFGNYISSDGTSLATHFDPLFSIAPVASAIVGILLAAWL